MQSFLSQLIVKHTQHWLRNLQADLRLSLWGGDVVLNNMEFRLSSLNESLALPSPLIFSNGTISEVIIKIPWAAITSQPILVTLSRVQLTLSSKDYVDVSPISTSESTDLVDNDGLLQDNNLIDDIWDRIVANIQVNINELIISLEYDGNVLSFSFDKAVTFSANSNWSPCFNNLDDYFRSIHRIVVLSGARLRFNSDILVSDIDLEVRLRRFMSPTLSASKRRSIALELALNDDESIDLPKTGPLSAISVMFHSSPKLSMTLRHLIKLDSLLKLLSFHTPKSTTPALLSSSRASNSSDLLTLPTKNTGKNDGWVGWMWSSLVDNSSNEDYKLDQSFQALSTLLLESSPSQETHFSMIIPELTFAFSSPQTQDVSLVFNGISITSVFEEPSFSISLQGLHCSIGKSFLRLKPSQLTPVISDNVCFFPFNDESPAFIYSQDIRTSFSFGLVEMRLDPDLPKIVHSIVEVLPSYSSQIDTQGESNIPRDFSLSIDASHIHISVLHSGKTLNFYVVSLTAAIDNQGFDLSFQSSKIVIADGGNRLTNLLISSTLDLSNRLPSSFYLSMPSLSLTISPLNLTFLVSVLSVATDMNNLITPSSLDIALSFKLKDAKFVYTLNGKTASITCNLSSIQSAIIKNYESLILSMPLLSNVAAIQSSAVYVSDDPSACSLSFNSADCGFLFDPIINDFVNMFISVNSQKKFPEQLPVVNQHALLEYLHSNINVSIGNISVLLPLHRLSSSALPLVILLPGVTLRNSSNLLNLDCKDAAAFFHENASINLLDFQSLFILSEDSCRVISPFTLSVHISTDSADTIKIELDSQKIKLLLSFAHTNSLALLSNLFPSKPPSSTVSTSQHRAFAIPQFQCRAKCDGMVLTLLPSPSLKFYLNLLSIITTGYYYQDQYAIKVLLEGSTLSSDDDLMCSLSRSSMCLRFLMLLDIPDVLMIRANIGNIKVIHSVAHIKDLEQLFSNFSQRDTQMTTPEIDSLTVIRNDYLLPCSLWLCIQFNSSIFTFNSQHPISLCFDGFRFHSALPSDNNSVSLELLAALQSMRELESDFSTIKSPHFTSLHANCPTCSQWTFKSSSDIEISNSQFVSIIEGSLYGIKLIYSSINLLKPTSFSFQIKYRKSSIHMNIDFPHFHFLFTSLQLSHLLDGITSLLPEYKPPTQAFFIMKKPVIQQSSFSLHIRAELRSLNISCEKLVLHCSSTHFENSPSSGSFNIGGIILSFDQDSLISWMADDHISMIQGSWESAGDAAFIEIRPFLLRLPFNCLVFLYVLYNLPYFDYVTNILTVPLYYYSSSFKFLMRQSSIVLDLMSASCELVFSDLLIHQHASNISESFLFCTLTNTVKIDIGGFLAILDNNELTSPFSTTIIVDYWQHISSLNTPSYPLSKCTIKLSDIDFFGCQTQIDSINAVKSAVSSVITESSVKEVPIPVYNSSHFSQDDLRSFRVNNLESLEFLPLSISFLPENAIVWTYLLPRSITYISFGAFLGESLPVKCILSAYNSVSKSFSEISVFYFDLRKPFTHKINSTPASASWKVEWQSERKLPHIMELVQLLRVDSEFSFSAFPLTAVSLNTECVALVILHSTSIIDEQFRFSVSKLDMDLIPWNNGLASTFSTSFSCDVLNRFDYSYCRLINTTSLNGRISSISTPPSPIEIKPIELCMNSDMDLFLSLSLCNMFIGPRMLLSIQHAITHFSNCTDDHHLYRLRNDCEFDIYVSHASQRTNKVSQVASGSCYSFSLAFKDDICIYLGKKSSETLWKIEMKEEKEFSSDFALATLRIEDIHTIIHISRPNHVENHLDHNIYVRVADSITNITPNSISNIDNGSISLSMDSEIWSEPFSSNILVDLGGSFYQCVFRDKTVSVMPSWRLCNQTSINLDFEIVGNNGAVAIETHLLAGKDLALTLFDSMTLYLFKKRIRLLKDSSSLFLAKDQLVLIEFCPRVIIFKPPISIKNNTTIPLFAASNGVTICIPPESNADAYWPSSGFRFCEHEEFSDVISLVTSSISHHFAILVSVEVTRNFIAIVFSARFIIHNKFDRPISMQSDGSNIVIPSSSSMVLYNCTESIIIGNSPIYITKTTARRCIQFDELIVSYSIICIESCFHVVFYSSPPPLIIQNYSNINIYLREIDRKEEIEIPVNSNQKYVWSQIVLNPSQLEAGERIFSKPEPPMLQIRSFSSYWSDPISVKVSTSIIRLKPTSVSFPVAEKLESIKLFVTISNSSTIITISDLSDKSTDTMDIIPSSKISISIPNLAIGLVDDSKNWQHKYFAVLSISEFSMLYWKGSVSTINAELGKVSLQQHISGNSMMLSAQTSSQFFTSWNESDIILVSIKLSPLQIAVQEQIIMYFIKIFRVLSLSNAASTQSECENHIACILAPKICIQNLFIDSIKMRLSISTKSTPVKLRARAVPVNLNMIRISSVVTSFDSLMKEIGAKFFTDMILRAPVILGSFDLFFNPTGLIENMVKGFRSFSYNSWSVGVSSFMRHIGTGAMQSLSGFSSALSEAIRGLSFEQQQEAINQLRIMRINNFNSGVTEGLSSFGSSAVNSLLGIFTSPISEVRDNESSWPLSFMVGLGKGLAGAITHPISGILDAVTCVSEGVVQSLSMEIAPEFIKLLPDEDVPFSLPQAIEIVSEFGHAFKGYLRGTLQLEHMGIEIDGLIVLTDNSIIVLDEELNQILQLFDISKLTVIQQQKEVLFQETTSFRLIYSNGEIAAFLDLIDRSKRLFN